MTKKNGKLPSVEQSQKAKRTNLAEWWAQQFTELDLPSGLHVVVRDVDMEDLLSNNSIPNTLMSFFPELQGLKEEEAIKKLMDEKPEAYAELLNIIVKSCIVEPKIGDVSDGVSTIALSDIRGKDKRFVFEWANREMKTREPFREGQSEPIKTP